MELNAILKLRCNPQNVPFEIWTRCFCRFTEIKEAGRNKRKLKEETGKDNSSLPIDSLEIFENIAFLMHKHGDPTQPSEIDEWLEQFETFSIYKVLPEILEMWGLENKQMSVSKKRQRNR